METGYYVDIEGYQFVVKYARQGEAPIVVSGPYWTATAALEDALRRAARGAAPIGDKPPPDHAVRWK